jgi:ATP-dependent RNA helicase RhlE
MEERPFLALIQKLINQKIPVITDHPFVGGSLEVAEKAPPRPHRLPAHLPFPKHGTSKESNKPRNFRKPGAQRQDRKK